MKFLPNIIKGIKQLEKVDRPYIVGIDGLSGAGKTTITEDIKNKLQTEGYKIIVIHIDDLLEERSKRYNTGHPEWFEYYMLQWDVQYIKESLFEAVHQKGNHINLKFYDTVQDRCYSKRIDLEQITLIFIEGIFLQRNEWRAYFDYMIYLDCPREARYQRVLQRDTYIGDMKERLNKYERRYWLAEDYYIKEENPLENSDIVIESSL
ncbi:kinase [Psychrobacillus sp. NPDC058041]|uniref:kinase n=1 Tax=Psychrobacillus sp. NPDC058041 TaxID=3346310 RepID=UPI0036D9E42C